jgi:hypothetical protein
MVRCRRLLVGWPARLLAAPSPRGATGHFAMDCIASVLCCPNRCLKWCSAFNPYLWLGVTYCAPFWYWPMGSGDNPLGGYSSAPCVCARHDSIEQLAGCCHPSLHTNLAAANVTKCNATHWHWPTVAGATSICCILQRDASNWDAFNIPIWLPQLQHNQQQQRLHTPSLLGHSSMQQGYLLHPSQKKWILHSSSTGPLRSQAVPTRY